jgi:geranylgeranyl pyrophosphate synthase
MLATWDYLLQNYDFQRWAYVFGIMFQISDDLLDIEQDERNKKPNICSILHMETARRMLEYLTEWLKLQLVEISNTGIVDCELLAEIIGIVHDRK